MPQPNPSSMTPAAGSPPGLAWYRWFVIDSAPLTLAFWGAVALVALAFLLCPYPPMIDYPQHVAMGAVLHRLFDPASPAHQTFRTYLFTYNAGIETLIALLAYLVRPELAGRIVLAAYAVLFGASALALCDVSRRPRWYALLALPLTYNFITGWGFGNFILALPLSVLAIAFWLRILDGSRSRLYLALTTVLSMMVAYTHVLAMLCVCVTVAVESLVLLFQRDDEHGKPLLARVRALVVPALVLVPSVAWSLGAWWWARKTSTTVWEHEWAEGQDDPLWQKLWHLLYNAAGNFADGSEQRLLVVGVVIAAALWLGSEGAPADRRMKRLGITFFGLYLLIPKVFIATFHIYPRFLPYAALFAVAAIPVARGKWTRLAAAAASVLALGSGANVLYRFLTIPEMADAMAIIDDAPPGRRLATVMFDPTPPTLSREIWVHLPALYQVRRDGIIAYSFMRNESVPVHYLPGKEPARPPGGFEWDGRLYDITQPYARDYDLILVRSWIDQDTGQTADPASYVFKDYAPYAKLLSRRGRFFLYDASDVNQVISAWQEQNSDDTIDDKGDGEPGDGKARDQDDDEAGDEKPGKP